MDANNIDHEALRRRFNPEGSELRQMQLRMLDILTEVDTICRRHNIPYWLSSGTLIGAFRHNGYIPWDDDLDIEMRRNDYLRLLPLLREELPDHLALQTMDDDPNYFFFFAKVRDRRSYIEEDNNYDRIWKERGLFIDIFPMERQRMWIHKISEQAHGHVFKIWRTSTDDERSMRKIRRITRFNRKVTFPVLRALCRLTGAHIWTSGMGIPFHNPRLDEDLFPLGEHVFEGRMFPVPHDSDHHLRLLYGDWTKLPDLDKIQPHARKVELNAVPPNDG